METNKAPNQNPEESKETKQEENSKPVTVSTEKTTESKEKPAKPKSVDSEAKSTDDQTIEKDESVDKSTEEQVSIEPLAKEEEKKAEKIPAAKPSSPEVKAEDSEDKSEMEAEEELPTEAVAKEEEKKAESKPAAIPTSPEVKAEDSEDKSEKDTEEKAAPESTSIEEDKPTDETPEKEKEKAPEVTVEATEELEILDEHDDEEEEDDDHHEEAEEEKANYDDMELEELVTLLEEIVEGEEIGTLRKKVALIKVSFLKKHKSHIEKHLEAIAKAGDEGEGKESPKEKDELGKRFDAAFRVYSKKRKAFLDQQEQQKQTNLDTKKLILEELKALIESEESLKKTYDDFKELQEKWKNVGLVPKSEVNNLWQNYHFYVEKFFDKVKINKELRDLDLKKNLESKIELCEKAEELLLETSVLKSFKQLQQYHRQWKEIGPVPQDKKDELWDRFKSTTEKINEGRREHYNKLKSEQEANLVSKAALCEKAEEILKIENNSIKEWNTNTNQISELLKFWKTIGPAPRKQNDEIWERFKTSLDTFFAGKKEYFQKIKEEQMHNYNLKLDLCAQAEAIKENTDWKNTTRDLINLQKDWKKIGPVPRKHSDKVWQRFRAACDEFFNNKSSYFANIKSHESDNLKAKEELVKKVESFEYGEDKNENLETLKGFQREWTEIGHVPFKEKDKVQNSFRNVINEQLDKLKISRAEMQTANYKQRFENIKDKADSGRILRNEKYFLAQKMKKLEDEIQLLENNMGFLAQSKKADLLKLEFTKKIESARNEVQVIKEKIKFLEREAE